MKNFMEIKKYLLIQNSDWKTLKDEVTRSKKVTHLSMPQVTMKPLQKYDPQFCKQSRPRSKLNVKNIHDFIDEAKKAVSREKIIPDSLKRAIFLSDIFTEKRNQLNFQSTLKKIKQELADDENRKFVTELQQYRVEQLEKKQQATGEKIALGKRLKKEILELKSKKKKEKIQEIKNERDELVQVHDAWQIDENHRRVQAKQVKQNVDKMHLQDIQAKYEDVKIHETVDNEETKISNTQFKFIHLTDDIRKKIDKSVNVVIPPKIESLEANTRKEIIRRYHDLTPVKKSKLEEKRDLYLKLLKQDRVQGHVFQMDDLLKRKMSGKREKETEYEQRLRNIKVTDKFQQLQRHKILNRVNEYRKIWNNQCNEKKLSEEKCKQEDVVRREKLVQKIHQEDEEYLADASALLNKYQKQDKIVMPIIKCIENAMSKRKKKPPIKIKNYNDENGIQKC